MPPDTLWHDSSAEPAPGTSLQTDMRVDLAVIGGGFTGCSAALEAAGQGASVALFEAGEIGDGGSGRNVGLVNAGLWLPPDAIAQAIGAEEAGRLVDLLAGAPDRVFDLIDRHGIDCAALRAGTLHCAHAPGALNGLRDRLAQGNRLGAPLRLLDSDETARRTGATGLAGALFDPRAGTIQPLAYARGLARAAAAAGAKIHVQSPVRRIIRHGEDWRLEVGGHTVTARAVLLATNAYHRDLSGPVRPRFVTVGYSQFATDPLPGDLRERILPGGEGCWDTARVMSSFRVDGAGRLILGGIGDLSLPGGRIHRAWARRKLAALFPEAAHLPFAHAWSGRIAMTGDHVPKIVAFGQDALAVFGYSGRGIGPGTAFGTLAARALLARDPAHLPLTPVPSHDEPFARGRAAAFELGAGAVHATTMLRRGRG
ncbi:Glycine/D-amino acid oxidase [Palleronia salina]|uniref:Glycine/D-amino acid oxidase n=1 Tax=Palleronia salina TaxID=313368 RepID=A0A1M6F6T9_9RHOB|nr:FAD-binding oxidoreductase [Palleronia salina]SHI93454.1 Glycine/D-amino acid oxidase [Palleronia salina]